MAGKKSAKRKKAPMGEGIEVELRAAVDAAVDAGETRHSLSVRAGIPQITLDRWIRRERRIEFGTAAKIAAALGLRLVAEKSA